MLDPSFRPSAHSADLATPASVAANSNSDSELSFLEQLKKLTDMLEDDGNEPVVYYINFY